MPQPNRKFTSAATFPQVSAGETAGVERSRVEEREAFGDEIYRHCLPSARYINNDIGVFTSTHASKRVQGRLLYRGGGLRYITHPVESRVR